MLPLCAEVKVFTLQRVTSNIEKNRNVFVKSAYRKTLLTA